MQDKAQFGLHGTLITGNSKFAWKTKKLKELKKSDVRENILENTDFFQNAKFAFGLAICYFLFEK